MNTYKLIVSYKGTNFSGWQIQKNDRTIQGEINSALRKISKSENISTLGSGRTDAGVHAIGQVCKITIPIDIEPESLLAAINSNTPESIHGISLTRISPEFHPIANSVWKEYWYIFGKRGSILPHLQDQIASCSHDVNLDLMKEGCQLFIGEHDFTDFYCTGSEIHSTIRNILSCTIESYRPEGLFGELAPDNYVLKIRGEGFLKQMVRLIVGTLWNVGREKTTLDIIEKSLSGESQGKLGSTAPAMGLYLKEVQY